MKPLGPLVLAFWLLSGGAQAQDSAQGGSRPDPSRPAPEQALPEQALKEREVKGAAGKDIRLLVLTNVRPDCTSGPLPSVRLVTPPANGKVIVRRVKLNATNVRQCLALEVPALVAVYRSAPEFEGDDTVMVEIRLPNGAPQLRRIKIGVSKQAPDRSI
jgi:hypothetical protein